MKAYDDFIKSKITTRDASGFECDFSDSPLYDFQREIINFSLVSGKSSIFADCGLGKTPMQLVWADKVCRQTSGRVLIVAPLAVSDQTVRESIKFGITAEKSKTGDLGKWITVTNYERLHYFKPDDFVGIVLDESSILKNYAGKIREAITIFMQDIPYRLLCTATPAPNDYMEFGTSAEALSIMRRVEMLAQYFAHNSGDTQKWTLRGHAENPFWKWMSTWSRAIRKPSDLGYDDKGFILPEFKVMHKTIKSKAPAGSLFPVVAATLNEQRAVRRESLTDRCEMAASIANATDNPVIAWCDLNDESALLTKLICGAVEIKGGDSDEHKEKSMLGFSNGDIRCVVTKPSIAGFGMNWQHCADMTFFPTHSHEQFYQATRRCWRYGQSNSVTCSLIYTESEMSVVENLMRKERNANAMYDKIIANMKSYQTHNAKREYTVSEKMEVPKWLKSA